MWGKIESPGLPIGLTNLLETKESAQSTFFILIILAEKKEYIFLEQIQGFREGDLGYGLLKAVSCRGVRGHPSPENF